MDVYHNQDFSNVPFFYFFFLLNISEPTFFENILEYVGYCNPT